jgi:hypothetical protein
MTSGALSETERRRAPVSGSGRNSSSDAGLLVLLTALRCYSVALSIVPLLMFPWVQSRARHWRLGLRVRQFFPL